MKLREIFNELVEFVSGADGRDFRNVAESYLLSNGFRFLGAGTNAVAYSHPGWGGIVVKLSYYGVDLPPNLNEHPEMREYWLKPLFRSCQVMIQPLAEPLEHANATDIANELYSRFLLDIHEGNIGLWRGRVVIFDC